MAVVEVLDAGAAGVDDETGVAEAADVVGMAEVTGVVEIAEAAEMTEVVQEESDWTSPPDGVGAEEVQDLAWADPAHTAADKYRQVGGCIGYTWLDLPVSSCRPPLPKKDDARRAILAARMAFSSFCTLAALR